MSHLAMPTASGTTPVGWTPPVLENLTAPAPPGEPLPRLGDQARTLRGLVELREAAPPDPDAAPRRHCRTVAIASGKGGVGKSNIALNLAIALAREGRRVCLLDANLGLGNIEILCGLNGYWNLSHVLTGARSLQDIILKGPDEISVIPGASGITDLADCPDSAQREILRQLEELEATHDEIVIDTGTGIHRLVRQFSTTADHVLVVTTPEPTAVADAYATIKTLSSGPAPDLGMVVNLADSVDQARNITERLQRTARMFLHCDVRSFGCIPRDANVPYAVQLRTPFLVQAPQSPASRAVRQIAHRLRNSAGASGPSGTFFARLWQRVERRAA